MIEELKKENPEPLSKLHAYLVGLETSVGLLRRVCLELKELVVVVSMIVFFVYEVVKHLF